MAEINAKHKQFADFYLSDPTRNARQAYKKVYPKSKDNAADVSASVLLKNPKVKAYIEEINQRTTEQVELTREMVINQIIEDRKKANELKQIAVAMKGNELLGKHLGMFTDNVNVKDTTFEDILRRKNEQNDK